MVRIVSITDDEISTADDADDEIQYRHSSQNHNENMRFELNWNLYILNEKMHFKIYNQNQMSSRLK